MVLFYPTGYLNGGLREYVWHRFLSESTALALSGVLLAGLILCGNIFCFLPPIKRLDEKRLYSCRRIMDVSYGLF